MSEIVTSTMNPALDIATSTQRVVPTDKLRCGQPRYDPGGGGVNVARCVRALGGDAMAVFPAGGSSGQVVVSLLDAEGVPCRCVGIGESTRESIAVNEVQTGQQYRFVLPGPRLTRVEQQRCLDSLAEEMSGARFVVASGSLPPGVPADYFQQVSDMAEDKGVKLVVDTSGEPLRRVTSGVFLLKPSIRELRERVGLDLLGEREQVSAARSLVDAGVCEVVVLSLGAHGALAVTADTAERFDAVHVPVRSGVGAGDSMVAALTLSLARGQSLSSAVRLGIAAGAATLMVSGTAPGSRVDVERIYPMVKSRVLRA